MNEYTNTLIWVIPDDSLLFSEKSDPGDIQAHTVRSGHQRGGHGSSPTRNVALWEGNGQKETWTEGIIYLEPEKVYTAEQLLQW